jgi:Protein of unknown function (DUF1569).
MLSIYDSDVFTELKGRLNKLTASAKPLWGKMTIDQMLHHLNLSMEAALGKMKPTSRPVFFMRIFKSVLYNDKPFGKGSPTPKDFKITGSFDFNTELNKANQNLSEVSERGQNGNFKPHVFFGTLTNEQWGKHIYKHIDHHLRQFGV